MYVLDDDCIVEERRARCTSIVLEYGNRGHPYYLGRNGSVDLSLHFEYALRVGRKPTIIEETPGQQQYSSLTPEYYNFKARPNQGMNINMYTQKNSSL